MQEEKDWWKNNILICASAIKILDSLISISLCMPPVCQYVNFRGAYICGWHRDDW